jgi:glyoxylase I family protein
MESGGVRPSLAGLHHLGVSVTDLERSLRFYCDVVGADVLVDDATSVASPAFVGRAAILSLGGRVFDLYEHSRNGGERFDPAHTGLDHLALEARSPEELQVWAAWIDLPDIAEQR